MTLPDSTVTAPTPPRAGVIGVGAMGENHARVYSESRGVELAGIADLDAELAECVAEEYGTVARSMEDLFDHCDMVSVAVPTAAHFETAKTCLEAGVHVLIEKPITARIERGERLAELAAERGLVLQVGHIERFNPAVRTAAELVDDLDIIAIEAKRLGPPIDRTATDRVTLDLMIHDVDIVQSILGDEPSAITATGTADGDHATATLEFDDVVATVTASRVSQRKVRRLTITATDCLVEIDYLDQSVLLYRDSFPEFVSADAGTRYRHESVIERPEVKNREPLRAELESFVAAATGSSDPVVTAEDGLGALKTVREIDRRVADAADLEVSPQ